MRVSGRLQNDTKFAGRHCPSDWVSVCRGEPHVAGRQEFDDDFPAPDIGVKMGNGSAQVVARDCSESDLPDASTSHYPLEYNLGLGLSTETPRGRSGNGFWKRGHL
jgi:hypothetical protein